MMAIKDIQELIPALVIPNGASVSNVLDRTVFGDATAFSLFAPGTLDATTFVIEISPDGTNWFGWEDSSGTAIACPGASKARVYSSAIFKSMRIKAGANVAADRSFSVVKEFLLGG